ncbi:hypothetical protein Z947_3413 [Sulfitobacter geojensis]|nr:hypothetical protein Z947_3413 [Sulfitobacter geojensis]NYI28249.1 hypothetical protein [Sulfitobacter geojensis]
MKAAILALPLLAFTKRIAKLVPIFGSCDMLQSLAETWSKNKMNPKLRFETNNLNT